MPDVQSLYEDGLDIDEIVEATGLTKFQVRAEINKIDEPIHANQHLIPQIFVQVPKGRAKRVYTSRAVVSTGVRDRLPSSQEWDPETQRANGKKSWSHSQGKLAPCGTYAAYQRHMRRKEEACAPCKEAARINSREKRESKARREGRKFQNGGPRPRGRELAPCGTRAAYVRHYRAGEQACDPCKAANAAFEAERKQRTKAAA